MRFVFSVQKTKNVLYSCGRTVTECDKLTIVNNTASRKIILRMGLFPFKMPFLDIDIENKFLNRYPWS